MSLVSEGEETSCTYMVKSVSQCSPSGSIQRRHLSTSACVKAMYT